MRAATPNRSMKGVPIEPRVVRTKRTCRFLEVQSKSERIARKSGTAEGGECWVVITTSLAAPST